MILNDINLGGSCNLNCMFCNENNISYSLQNIKDKIDFLKNNSDTITITGGEPTIRKDFFNILDYCIDNFNHIILLSNCIMFSEEKFFNEFIKRDLNKIEISTSFDSHIKDVHNFLCGVDSYDKKIISLNKLNQIKNLKITLGIVINKLNINNINDWFDFINKNWNIKNIFFKVYNSYNNNIEVSNEMMPDYESVYSKINTIIHENIDKNFIIKNLPICFLKNLYKFSIEFNLIKHCKKNNISFFELRQFFENNVFHDKCKSCVHFSYCIGINKHYFLIYGEDFLIPNTNIFYNWEINNEL